MVIPVQYWYVVRKEPKFGYLKSYQSSSRCHLSNHFFVILTFSAFLQPSVTPGTGSWVSGMMTAAESDPHTETKSRDETRDRELEAPSRHKDRQYRRLLWWYSTLWPLYLGISVWLMSSSSVGPNYSNYLKYLNIKYQIVVFDIPIWSIFKTQIYLVFSIWSKFSIDTIQIIQIVWTQ